MAIARGVEVLICGKFNCVLLTRLFTYVCRTLWGIRRRLALKVEGLARVSKIAGGRPRLASVAFDGRYMGVFDREGPLGHKRPACMLLFVFLREGGFSNH